MDQSDVGTPPLLGAAHSIARPLARADIPRSMERNSRIPMRSKTVLSRRGLLVGAASLALAQPPERHLFRVELRESLMTGYARLQRIRGLKMGPFILHMKATFDA